MCIRDRHTTNPTAFRPRSAPAAISLRREMIRRWRQRGRRGSARVCAKCERRRALFDSTNGGACKRWRRIFAPVAALRWPSAASAGAFSLAYTRANAAYEGAHPFARRRRRTASSGPRGRPFRELRLRVGPSRRPGVLSDYICE